MVVEHMERLTVIRKLTMSCWHLRNVLLPLLWEYVEGWRVFARRQAAHHDPTLGEWVLPKSGLYDQCSYLAHNPIVGAYVQHVYPHTHPN